MMVCGLARAGKARHKCFFNPEGMQLLQHGNCQTNPEGVTSFQPFKQVFGFVSNFVFGEEFKVFLFECFLLVVRLPVENVIVNLFDL